MNHEKAKIRAYNGVFLNSKGIFIEYADIIKSPYFMIIVVLSALGKELPSPFEISPILSKELDELTEWYYMRKNQNPLLDLIEEEASANIKIKDINQYINNQITEEIVKASNELNMVNVINRLYGLHNELAGIVYVWYPYENAAIDDDIRKTLNSVEHINILHGDIVEALKKVPNDSTFIFSDVSNINALEYAGKLDFSSILIPVDYQYNFVDGEWLIDFEKLAKDHVFKLNKFFASIEMEEELPDEE